MNILSGLNKGQKEAVTHNKGPVLVVAGAGTGKTTVITKRIVHLIHEGYAKPNEILALTFTEKAAAEMLERVDVLSDYVYSDLSISTFHSFGADLISEFALELGLPVDVRVLSDIEQILFIRDHIFEFDFKHYENLNAPTSLIKEMIKLFSRAKDELISPDTYIKAVTKRLKAAGSIEEREDAERQLELANAYKKYNELMKSEGYIDYGDQIFLVSRLLSMPHTKKKIGERFKYALIDEFQDTNYAQSQIIKEIFGATGNVMVVGDDDQSIYKFRGASISNILNFREEYKNVKTIVLTENYRSGQAILDKAYALIQNNNPERLEAKYNIDKKLISKTSFKGEFHFQVYKDEAQEAEAIASEIISANQAGLPFSEIAILVRANSHAEEIVRTLRKRGVPYIFSGAAGLYEKLEVKMLVSLVRILFNEEDSLALFHLASSEVYNFSADELSRVMRWAAKRNKSLSAVFSGIETVASELELSEKTTHLATKIVTDLSGLREEAKTATAGEVVNLFLRVSGYYSRLTREARNGSIEAHSKITNIASFFDKIIHFQRNYKDHSLEKFGEYLEMIIDVGDDPKSAELEEGLDAVNVVTIHKSKGLEFDTVFVASLSDSHFPSKGGYDRLSLPEELVHGSISETSDKYQEERRLFYVAITRAKKKLFLTAAQDYGTRKTHKISRFAVEVVGEENVEKRFLVSEPIDRIRHFERVSNLYGVTLEPIPEREIMTVSRQAIDDWLSCPFKYQLIHITPIRLVADSNIAYGNAIHNTIGEYYKRRMAGKKVVLIEIYELYNLFWDEAGFLSRDHERKRYTCGKKALKRFYEEAEKGPLPEYIEKEFKLKIGQNIIKGRYDAIFKEKDGHKIIDFKTSNITRQADAERRTKESKQLATYALAWYAASGSLPSETRLYFVDTGLVGSYVPTMKSAQKTKDEIERACSGIRRREFGANPNLMTCAYCPYRFYCPESITEKTVS